MASAKPLQPGSWRAHLYLVREVGIDYLAELTGCARDGVALQLEEAAPAAGVQPGDLLLVITKDDRIEKMARLRDGLKHPDVDQARRKADGYTKEAMSETDRFKDAMVDIYHKFEDMKGSALPDVRYEEDDTEEDDEDDIENMNKPALPNVSNEEEDKDATEEEEVAEERSYLQLLDLDDDSSNSDEEADVDKEATNEYGSVLSNEKDDKEATEEEDDAEERSFLRLLDLDDDSSNSDEEAQLPRFSIKLCLWASYAVLILHDGRRWKLTRQHTLHWLSTVGSQIEKDQTQKTKAFSSWQNESIPADAFEGYLENSTVADKFIRSNLSPHVNDFIFSKILGVSSDAKVYCCSYMDTSLGDVQFALKKMQITDEFDDEGAIDYQEPREVTIFSSLKNSSIVSFFQAWASDGLYKTNLERSDDEQYEVWEDSPDPRHVIIQMNLCFRTLDELLSIGESRVIDVEEAWTYFREITKAVQYIHQNGVIHRDLKPANIFLGPPGTCQVMIGDFGHSCWLKNYVDGKKGTPSRGTPLYSAPELKNTSVITDKVDIYSIGVILVELFRSFGTGGEKCEVLGGLREGIHPTEWGGDTVLLKRLTALSPSERPSATDILDYMANPQ